ncbi:YbgA family protein [Clostridium sp.]|uniref:YbgA family protein n=1 Tax=Clostridium sp. TaxID=1506 RepID=UPI003F360BD0
MRRPKLVVSKCLGFENCRYNGQGSSSKLIDLLGEHVDFYTVCPEVEIGLSTPREAIRVVDYEGSNRLIQPKNNIDFTNNMREFSKKYISTLDDIDGFILKSKSPSCGIKDVKIYHKSGQGSLTSGGNGLFAQEIVDNKGHLPIENEGRLKNYSIRDEFLTKIFIINDFKNNFDNIKEFHTKHELMIKSYGINNYHKLNELCDLANKSKDYMNNYSNILYDTLKINRNYKKNIQVIIDIYTKYEKYLSMKEKEIFVDNIMKYSKGKLPLSSVLTNIKVYAARFDDELILKQSIFNPYPENLIDISDSGKGRSI